MRELTVMLERKYPGSTHSEFFRRSAWRWMRQYYDLAKLQARNPAAYERGLIGLVDWIGEHAAIEIAEGEKLSKGWRE